MYLALHPRWPTDIIHWLTVSQSPFAVIRFHGVADNDASAKALVSRSILSTGIYELWGAGTEYDSLHADVRKRTERLWDDYRTASFRFEVDSFHGSRSTAEQRSIIETFGYMAFEGPIRMSKPDHRFKVFEDYDLDGKVPTRLFLGRFVATSGRKAITKYDLKKRSYIATTSMDAELSLVTANMALAAPGKLAYDPFMGTGSFPLSCAHFGASVFGSDLDGRMIRGKKDRHVKGNFAQYGTSAEYLGGFVADLTNMPLRRERLLDAIICDPPYGVREGLKVLGSTRVALQQVVYLADGTPAHLQENYVPPKKPYSFLRMLDDILDFSADVLAQNGRLCMWMPVAGVAPEEDIPADAPTTLVAPEYDIPQHPALKLISLCTQDFSKWSRRLLTYRRFDDVDVDQAQLAAYKMERLELLSVDDGGTRFKADDLNAFRKRYFQGFKDVA